MQLDSIIVQKYTSDLTILVFCSVEVLSLFWGFKPNLESSCSRRAYQKVKNNTLKTIEIVVNHIQRSIYLQTDAAREREEQDKMPFQVLAISDGDHLNKNHKYPIPRDSPLSELAENTKDLNAFKSSIQI